MDLNFNNKQQDLKPNEMNILLINAFKTKTNKTCIQYAFVKKIMGEYEKGFPIVMQQWFDKVDMFNSLKDDMFGKICKAKFEYKLRNNGQAYISISEICS